MSAAIIGEIRASGFLFHNEREVNQDMIESVVNTDSKNVQNSIIIKTMRIPINEVLGSKDNIDLLDQIKDMASDFYDSQIVKIIDYMWEAHGWKVILFNSIYILYPIVLSLIIALP